MHRRFERARSSMRAVLREIRREDVKFMAASIAYHAFVSMFPLLVLLMLVVSVFGSQRFTATVIKMTKALLPATGERVVINTLRNATGSVGLSVVGVGILLWGTSKIFRAMDAAFAELYDTERELSLLGQVRDTLVVLVALVLAAIAAIVLGTVVRIPTTVPFGGLLNGAVAVVGLAVAFFPIYYVFPNLDVSFRDALPGTLIAAVGWVGLKWLFNLYVMFSNKPRLYGLIGTLVLLVTWLYVGGLVLLIGGAVNSTLAGRGDNRMVGHGKRRFGRQVTDVDSFERRLNELVSRAGDADIPDEEIRLALQREAEKVGTAHNGRGIVAAGDEQKSKRD